MKLNPWILAGLGILAFATTTDEGDYLVTQLANTLGLTTEEQKANYAKYRPAIESAERASGLPAGLLARLLKAESSYLTSIITGARKSSAGAIGIAQFMPATAAEWKVDPYDPLSSIAGAARYLKWLYSQLGTWTQAVAAYNHGIGNVRSKVRTYGTEWTTYLPKETRDYIGKIIA